MHKAMQILIKNQAMNDQDMEHAVAWLTAHIEGRASQQQALLRLYSVLNDAQTGDTVALHALRSRFGNDELTVTCTLAMLGLMQVLDVYLRRQPHARPSSKDR